MAIVINSKQKKLKKCFSTQELNVSMQKVICFIYNTNKEMKLKKYVQQKFYKGEVF